MIMSLTGLAFNIVFDYIFVAGISFRIFYCPGKWFYLGTDLINAFFDPGGRVHTDPAEAYRDCRRLDDDAAGRSRDYFYSVLSVSNIRKKLPASPCMIAIPMLLELMIC